LENYQSNITIKVLSDQINNLKLKKNIELVSLADLRFNLKRDKYIEIRNKIMTVTNKNLIQLFNNLEALKTLDYKGISLAKLLEINLIVLFNEYLGQYELLKSILKREQFDRIILFNFSRVHLPIFRSLNFNYNIEVYKDKFLTKTHNFLKLINISMCILISSALFIKKRLFHKNKAKNRSFKKKKDTILFLTDTKNQFYSVKPVYDGLLEYGNISPKHYSCETFLELSKLAELLRYLLRIRKVISINKEKIVHGLNHESFSFYTILTIFYDYNLFIHLTKIFNMVNNLIKFIGDNLPVLVVIANDYSIRGRLEIGYFKLKNIPLVYIPHAGIPIMEELATTSEVSYITVSGEFEKNYLVNKGESKEKIKITGRPRYQNFHKGKIQRLLEVQDIFDARKYKFNTSKFTVLLATNPIDNKSNEKIITSVVNSLKDLNLIDNLIIKLHPRENGLLHKKILNKLEVSPIIVKDYNILDLIKSCDLLLSGVSNTILEAMIIGTPVVQLDFINVNFIYTSRYIFTEDQSIVHVKNQEELIAVLQKFILNKDFYSSYSESLKNLSKGYSFYDEKENPTKKIINLFLKEIK
ncbi:MAG: UDP-N-acetylglucosamine 2-epimerase, partial [Candidatus Odinarchaeota archaeon]